MSTHEHEGYRERRASHMEVTEYYLLKESGMMWELYPEFTGDYDEDMRILECISGQNDGNV